MISSCNSNYEFDSNKWKQNGADWWMTDVREKMIDDLIKSDTLISMNEEQIIKLLGQPESTNDGGLKYLIREKYGSNIDPEYISNLKIEFDKNGEANKCKVER